MKIAIDGAASSGKTQVLKNLRQSLRPFVPCKAEASRKVAPRHGVTSPEAWMKLIADKDRLENFFTDIEDWQCRSEAHPTFVIDSSMLIHYCYRRIFEGVPALDLAARIDRYDLIIYCEAGGEGETDAFRTLHGRREFLKMYQEEIKPLLREKLVELPWMRTSHKKVLKERANLALEAVLNRWPSLRHR